MQCMNHTSNNAACLGDVQYGGITFLNGQRLKTYFEIRGLLETNQLLQRAVE